MTTFRNRTRVIAIVHSHITDNDENGVINLSDDLITVKLGKSVKGAGQANLTVVPRRNYFNFIFPNDVINIYIDPGDGKSGFIRVFMGYLDRIERTSQVTDDQGSVSTVFSIKCSDFTKAFDRTDIYFNPQLSAKSDLIDARFGNSLLAGTSLRTAGIIAHGSPADMIENLATLLLGFGAQWRLPKSYAKNVDKLKTNRERRRQRAKAKVPGEILSQAADLLGISVEGIESTLLSEQEDIENLLSLKAAKLAQGTNPGGTTNEDLLNSFFLSFKKGYTDLFENTLSLRTYKTVVQESGTSAPFTIIDLIDFSFIEAMTIDGYIVSKAVWKSQGSLASIMYGYCNEAINELMFDLRPVVEDSTQGFHDSCFGERYSTRADELGINVDGVSGTRGDFSASVPAVKYVPAIVFREYPHSTVEGLDLQNLFVFETRVGFTPFGPIFSQKRDVQGTHRVLYDYRKVDEIKESVSKTFLPSSCVFNPTSSPLKHLDVAQIITKEVISSAIGRSDHDVFNYFALYSSDSQLQFYKWLLQEFQPIVTPISIERHGLRVMEVTTRYANYSRDQLCEEGEGSSVGGGAITRNLIRWSLLLDHWNQHNVEYLTGTITIRGRPDIRVGYRLDWLDRNESYYVEGVEHQWEYGGIMITNLAVSRGQRNDPFPAYIPPTLRKDFGSKTIGHAFGAPVQITSELSQTGGGNRGNSNTPIPSRLSYYFKVLPHLSTVRSIGVSQKELDMLNEDNNLDKKPNADFGGRAEYAGIKAVRETRQVTLDEIIPPDPEDIADAESDDF